MVARAQDACGTFLTNQKDERYAKPRPTRKRYICARFARSRQKLIRRHSEASEGILQLQVIGYLDYTFGQHTLTGFYDLLETCGLLLFEAK